MAMLINDEIVLMSPSDRLVYEFQQTNLKKKSKTRQQQLNQHRRNQEKRELNLELSRLSPFTSTKPNNVVFINYKTPFFAVIRSIEQARQASFFSVDTESDNRSNEPALIQVQFIPSIDNQHVQEDENKTTIIIFEMFKLPSKTSMIYSHVEKLFDIIFHPSKTILSWGNEKQELSKFTKYPLFQLIPVDSLHIINVQNKFKNFYNAIHPHDYDCCMALIHNSNDDHPNCTCPYRLYKNPGNTWSLQLAIATMFKEFLDKSLTRSNWGQGLDGRLYENSQFGMINYNVRSSLTSEQDQMRQKLVRYAVADCLATTKLALRIGDYLFDD